LKSLPELNRKIWGLRPRALTTIGARTSNGKSSLALQFAFDLADQNIPVLFLSLEMTVESLIERLFCNVMKIDNYEILRGRLATEPDYQKKWQTFQEMATNLPLLITDGIGKTFGELNFLIERLEPKPKAVFIDYIQAIARKPGESREAINEYIRRFRELAIRYDFAGVLCSQLSRQSEHEGHKPSLWTLKETGNLEEASDTCLLLWWEYFYTYNEKAENNFSVIVAKQRQGRTGEHPLLFYPQFYRFEEKQEPIIEKAREIFEGGER
jgi:replicative DNA helicase